MRVQTFKLGDRVGYARRFLKSIGADYEMWQARGIVCGLRPLGDRTLVTVGWGAQADSLPASVIDANLAKVGTAEFVD
jgi:hypothetical protein